MQAVVEYAILPHPVELVFRAAADPRVQLGWDPKMTRVENFTRGRPANGARFRARFKILGIIEYEFAEFDPPWRFARRADTKAGELVHTRVSESL